MREDETVTASTPCCWAGCAIAGAEMSMAKTAVLLDSARRRFAQSAFAVEFMIFPLWRFGVSFFLRLFLCVESSVEWRISQVCHRIPGGLRASSASPGCGSHWRQQPDIAHL